MQLEHGGGFIDVLSQVELLDHLRNQTDAGAGNGLRLLTEFKLGGCWPNGWRLEDALPPIRVVTE